MNAFIILCTIAVSSMFLGAQIGFLQRGRGILFTIALVACVVTGVAAAVEFYTIGHGFKDTLIAAFPKGSSDPVGVAMLLAVAIGGWTGFVNSMNRFSQA